LSIIDKDRNRHLFARDGDNLITPFQCDSCVFRNLKGRNPSSKDDFLLACIHQVNLDALWRRDTATVGATLRAVKQTITALKQVHLPPPYPALGPYPVADTFGHSIAIAMIIKSWSAGRYAAYQQFEPIWKLRGGGGGQQRQAVLNTCPTNPPWFKHFARGCLSCMGQIVKQDRAVSLELMHAFLGLIEKEWSVADRRERIDLAFIGAYAVFAFCGSKDPRFSLLTYTRSYQIH